MYLFGVWAPKPRDYLFRDYLFRVQDFTLYLRVKVAVKIKVPFYFYLLKAENYTFTGEDLEEEGFILLLYKTLFF